MSPDYETFIFRRYDRLSASNGKAGVRDAETGGHATDTIDIAFVISGEIGLEQEGTEVTLRPGDVLVQMGAMHTWRNRGSEPCVMGFVLVGTERVG